MNWKLKNKDRQHFERFEDEQELFLETTEKRSTLDTIVGERNLFEVLGDITQPLLNLLTLSISTLGVYLTYAASQVLGRDFFVGERLISSPSFAFILLIIGLLCTISGTRRETNAPFLVNLLGPLSGLFTAALFLQLPESWQGILFGWGSLFIFLPIVYLFFVLKESTVRSVDHADSEV